MENRTIRENVSVSAQAAVLSEKISELSEANLKLEEKKREQRRKIQMMEEEQKKLTERNAYRYFQFMQIHV